MICTWVVATLAAVSVTADVSYSKAGGEDLKMDIYSPTPEEGKTFPSVVVIHGGAWMAGKRQDMAELCKAMAEKGLVAATVQYRLAPKHKWPAMLDDVQTAVRFLRDNAAKYKIDPNRIGASGASAGGHLALMLGSRDTRIEKPLECPEKSSRVSAVFDIFGPTDMNDFPASLDPVYQMVLGKKRAEAAEQIRDASPIQFIDAKSAPVFILHGEKDPLVPIRQSKSLEAKLKSLQVPVESSYPAEMVHAIDLKQEDQKKGIERGIAWLLRWLTKS